MKLTTTYILQMIMVFPLLYLSCHHGKSAMNLIAVYLG